MLEVTGKSSEVVDMLMRRRVDIGMLFAGNKVERRWNKDFEG